MIKQIVIVVLCVGIYNAKLSASHEVKPRSVSSFLQNYYSNVFSSHKLALLNARKKMANAYKISLDGVSLFQVKHNDSFALKVCYASTEYCLCVDKINRMPLTSLSRNIKSCKCFGERHTRKMEKVGFVPQCEADGFYKARQYDKDTGFICVDKHGTNLTEPSKGLQYCKCVRERHEKETDKSVGKKMKRDLDGSNCTCLFEKYLVDELIDVHIPTCDEDGNYSAMQCHKQYCWCTDTDGRILKNVKVLKNKLSEKCNCYRTKLPIEWPNCEKNI